MREKLAVFFPGRKYSVDCPLLYFTDFICKEKGYETKYLHYAAYREEKSRNTIEQDVNRAEEEVMAVLDGIDFSKYQEILFVSKSIGTVLAAKAQEKYQLTVRNVYFTPLEPTLPYLRSLRRNAPEENLIIAGTKDPFLEASVLKEVCEAENLPLHQFTGLGHSMETEHVMESLDTLKKIMGIVQDFLK